MGCHGQRYSRSGWPMLFMKALKSFTCSSGLKRDLHSCVLNIVSSPYPAAIKPVADGHGGPTVCHAGKFDGKDNRELGCLTGAQGEPAGPLNRRSSRSASTQGLEQAGKPPTCSLDRRKEADRRCLAQLPRLSRTLSPYSQQILKARDL